MPSITVWSRSNAGSISLTAALSFTDHLTLLLSGLARHVTESVNLTGMSSQNISPSIATHPHASTSHPTLFMSIKTFTLPMLTHRAHSFFWRLQRKAPMAVPLLTKGCGQSDSSALTNPIFFKQPHRQPKGTSVLRAKVKYICAHPLLLTGQVAGLRQCLIPLFGRLRGFPSQTATWSMTDHPLSVHHQDIGNLGQR